MAGAFIVLDKEGDDPFTELNDYVLLCQTFDFQGDDDDGNLLDLSTASGSNQPLNLLDKLSQGRYTMVNGQYLPKIQLQL